MEGETRAILSEYDISEILLFCDIARANGAHLSLTEAASLLRPNITEEEFVVALRQAAALTGSFKLQSGLILLRDDFRRAAVDLASYEAERRRRAERNLRYAFNFAAFSRLGESRVLSVSGSSSYGSASAGADIDFFCITLRESMWLALTRSLILARVFRLLRKDSPNLCFSYVIDENFAHKEFSENRGALFARDALNATVVLGADYYNQLLRDNGWLSEYFPKLYKERLASAVTSATPRSRREPNIVAKAANLFLYYTVAKYLRLKAALGNRILTKEGRLALLFDAKIGRDHCIYESVRYRDLRRLYAQLDRIKGIDASAFTA